jgi:hypothetical protein
MVMAKRKPEAVGQYTAANVGRAAALFDVQLLDLLAEIEALLRKGREAQREALRVRGEPAHSTNAQRVASAAKIARLAMSMGDDHRTLGTILRELRVRAADLERSVQERDGRR